MAVPVLADSEETQSGEIDWENTDWTQFDWRLLDDTMISQSLAQWLRNEADLHGVFMVCAYNRYEAFYVPGQVVTDRFFFDTGSVPSRIGAGSETCSGRVIDRVVYSLDAEPQEVVAVLETVTLSDTDSAATYALLREMISFAESAYQVKINNPKTADPLTAVLFLLPISAAGLAIVLRRRKYVACPAYPLVDSAKSWYSISTPINR